MVSTVTRSRVTDANGSRGLLGVMRISRDLSPCELSRGCWMHPANRHAVLVVDDYAALRDALVMQLRCAGHAVRAAASGRAALEALAEGYRPCLILLDLWMPEMDGLQVCEAIKANPRTASIPVVMLTGDMGVVLGESEGVAGMLTKPAEMSVLVATIADHARCADDSENARCARA